MLLIEFVLEGMTQFLHSVLTTSGQFWQGFDRWNAFLDIDWLDSLHVLTYHEYLPLDSQVAHTWMSLFSPESEKILFKKY